MFELTADRSGFLVLCRDAPQIPHKASTRFVTCCAFCYILTIIAERGCRSRRVDRERSNLDIGEEAPSRWTQPQSALARRQRVDRSRSQHPRLRVGSRDFLRLSSQRIRLRRVYIASTASLVPSTFLTISWVSLPLAGSRNILHRLLYVSDIKNFIAFSIHPRRTSRLCERQSPGTRPQQPGKDQPPSLRCLQPDPMDLSQGQRARPCREKTSSRRYHTGDCFGQRGRHTEIYQHGRRRQPTPSRNWAHTAANRSASRSYPDHGAFTRQWSGDD